MSSGRATPSSTIRIASSPSARPSREVAKPGESFTRTASLPSDATRSSARRSVSGDVSSPRTTSTSGMAATGLKKWIPTTRSRRPVARAIRVIESEEVLEARMVRSGQWSSSSLKTRRFRSRASGTASTTKSTAAPSRSRSTTRRSRRPVPTVSAATFPRSRARAQEASIDARTWRCASGSASNTKVSWPESAQSPAIPRPMTPAPTTSTLTRGIVLPNQRGPVVEEDASLRVVRERQRQEVLDVLPHRRNPRAREVGPPQTPTRDLLKTGEILQQLARRDPGEVQVHVRMAPHEEHGSLHEERASRVCEHDRQPRKIHGHVVHADRVGEAVPRAGEDRGRGVNHDRPAVLLRDPVDLGERFVSRHVVVGGEELVGRVDLEHPDPELLEQSYGVAACVSRPARMDRADGHEAVGVSPGVTADPLVDRLVEAHHVGRHVVDQGRPLDLLLVHQPEELPGVREDAFESLAVRASADHRRADGGAQLLPRLDVDVAVEDAKRQRDAWSEDVRNPEPNSEARTVRSVRDLGPEAAEQDGLDADALPRADFDRDDVVPLPHQARADCHASQDERVRPARSARQEIDHEPSFETLRPFRGHRVAQPGPSHVAVQAQGIERAREVRSELEVRSAGVEPGREDDADAGGDRGTPGGFGDDSVEGVELEVAR